VTCGNVTDGGWWQLPCRRALSQSAGHYWGAGRPSAAPIYDSSAQDAIGDLVDWELVGPIRKMLAKLPEWARAYRNFVAAFAILYERAHTETSLKPTVKELDHLLWQPR
jgi:hypothetical protein